MATRTVKHACFFILACCGFGHIVILEIVTLPPGTHKVVPMLLPVSQLFILHLAGSIFFLHLARANNLWIVYK
jgi:hypothetical protein